MALAFLHNKRPGIAVVRKSHSHSYTETVTPPTCTEEGYTTYTCACGYSYVDNRVDALGHDYNEAYEANEHGHWHICNRCGKASEVVAHIPGAEATASNPQVCVVCGYIIKEALCSHFWGEWSLIKQETCTESGEWERTCLLCGAVEKKEIPALGHQLNSTITKYATCSEKGERYYWCDRCDYNYTEEIPATGAHTKSDIGAVEATCTSEGSTAGSKCAVCGTFLVEPTILPYAPHTLSWVNDEDSHWKECAVCGLVEERGICDKDGLGNIAASATCTNNEWRYIACSVCGREYGMSAVKEMPGTALGHVPQTTVKSYSKTEHRYTTVCTRCFAIIGMRNERHILIEVGAKRRCKICGYEEYAGGGEIPLG